MSAPAAALTVLCSALYLAVGYGAATAVEFLYMDGELLGQRWTVHALALLAIPLWPVMLVLLLIARAIGSLFA